MLFGFYLAGAAAVLQILCLLCTVHLGRLLLALVAELDPILLLKAPRLQPCLFLHQIAVLLLLLHLHHKRCLPLRSSNSLRGPLLINLKFADPRFDSQPLMLLHLNSDGCSHSRGKCFLIALLI